MFNSARGIAVVVLLKLNCFSRAENSNINIRQRGKSEAGASFR